MKYVVSIRGDRDKEHVVEAANIVEASRITKKRHPKHLGYSIKPMQ
jgi:hypothetical protein